MTAHHQLTKLVAELESLQPRTAAVISRYTDEIEQLESENDIGDLKCKTDYCAQTMAALAPF
jgi:hypothetical protein